MSEQPADTTEQPAPAAPYVPHDYQADAQQFLERFGLAYSAEYVGPDCPLFCGPSDHGKHKLPCGGIHGGHYKVTFARQSGASLSFDFWNSYNDEYGGAEAYTSAVLPGCKPDTIAYVESLKKHIGFVRAGQWKQLPPHRRSKPPTAYNVLAGLSLDAHCPADFDEFCSEYGYDSDSRKAYATWERCVQHALKLTQFFTTDELAALESIQ